MIGEAVSPGAPAVPGVLGKEHHAGEHMSGKFQKDGQDHAQQDAALPAVAENSGVAQTGEADQVFHKDLGPVDGLPGGDEKEGQDAGDPPGEKGQPVVIDHRQQHQGQHGAGGNGTAGGQGDVEGGQHQSQGAGDAPQGQRAGVQPHAPAQPEGDCQIAHGKNPRDNGRDHRTYSPLRSKRWSMGPCPAPRSSMAARAPDR